MPTDLIRVDQVLVTPTREADVTRYDICSHVEPLHRPETFETINPWTASLCQTHAKTTRLLRVVWEDSRHGKEIVAAEVA